MPTNKQSIKVIGEAFLHPRVSVFILTGTLIIFLTFLTTNNALEIAISGIASVFIGIGVNNFSSFETRADDERKIKLRMKDSLAILELSRAKVARLRENYSFAEEGSLQAELSELEQFLLLVQHLTREAQGV